MSEERGIFIAAIQYVVVGLVTLVPNIYAFIRLVKCKKMRTSYGLMIFGLFAGFGCGFVTAANAFWILPEIVMFVLENLAHYEGLMFLHHFRAIIKLIYVLNTLNIALSSFIFQQEIRAFLLPGRQMPINATSVFGVTTRLSVPPQPLTSTKASS
uniref:G_PROTEIN_RECEP_F1_2 domain-containing protein n=1 Tax=Syphacia muris TaxID=451379 RepID=A0A0N5AXT2_9BILA